MGRRDGERGGGADEGAVNVTPATGRHLLHSVSVLFPFRRNRRGSVREMSVRATEKSFTVFRLA